MLGFSHAGADDRALERARVPKDTGTMARWLLGKVPAADQSVSWHVRVEEVLTAL